MCTHHQIFKRKSCVCYMQTKLCYHVGGCVCVVGDCRFQLLSGRSPYYAWIYNSQFIFDTHELVRATTSIQNNAINMEFFFFGPELHHSSWLDCIWSAYCTMYNVFYIFHILYGIICGATTDTTEWPARCFMAGPSTNTRPSANWKTTRRHLFQTIKHQYYVFAI